MPRTSATHFHDVEERTVIIYMNDRTTLIDKMGGILAYGSCTQFVNVQAADSMHQSGSTETRGP